MSTNPSQSRLSSAPPPFPFAHAQPGRRFATGSTRDDQLLGAFGFLAHATLFMAVGSAMVGRFGAFFWTNTLASAALLAVRAKQVGSTTTKESIQAIKQAWLTIFAFLLLVPLAAANEPWVFTESPTKVESTVPAVFYQYTEAKETAERNQLPLVVWVGGLVPQAIPDAIHYRTDFFPHVEGKGIVVGRIVPGRSELIRVADLPATASLSEIRRAVYADPLQLTSVSHSPSGSVQAVETVSWNYPLSAPTYAYDVGFSAPVFASPSVPTPPPLFGAGRGRLGRLFNGGSGFAGAAAVSCGPSG